MGNGANIIYSDDDNTITSALFGKPLQATQDYISKSVQNYVTALGGTTNVIAAQVQQKFDDIRSSVVIQTVSNIRNRLNSIWQTDSIRPLTNITEIQMAPPTMQRWVMAQPDLRARYNSNSISAYDKNYVDSHPGGVGPRHYDYRRVTDGIYMVADGESTCTNYFEQIDDEVDTLSLIEKRAIMFTWGIINDTLELGANVDPTSQWNGLL